MTFLYLYKTKNKTMYPQEVVKPMREHLTNEGFEELFTAESVDSALSRPGTTLVVINSVCGCAAANARPGAILSLKNKKIPNYKITAFAGVDKEAVEKVREHMIPFPPSSPCMALFKNGELVHMLERHHIEGRPAELIAENLMDAYVEFC